MGILLALLIVYLIITIAVGIYIWVTCDDTKHNSFGFNPSCELAIIVSPFWPIIAVSVAHGWLSRGSQHNKDMAAMGAANSKRIAEESEASRVAFMASEEGRAQQAAAAVAREKAIAPALAITVTPVQPVVTASPIVAVAK
jgi:cytochrome b